MGLNGMPGAGAGPGAGPGELRPCNGWVTISNRKFHGVVAARPTVENDDSVSRRTRSQLLDEPRTVVAMEWGEGMKTKQGSGAGLRYSSAGGVAWRGVRQRCEQKWVLVLSPAGGGRGEGGGGRRWKDGGAMTFCSRG
ncbi:hypothetical protein MPTK1_2g20830 [Marchantia polymorpha subsp. ruderalis]|uniref:Uncharacterized protein n=1 Tax=Marchantia polymorpha TaxID=3197 RepID=A0A2R6X2X6_MARPO|nr:hypothetical protein MARPO_0040s0129 [Marchantia polymorpha]BBN03108.1 hypothetical protein Mp_2g20830 [Marchantia polymorpha subsp. ruderalis]|eukprot:PTQ40467.1 hypothetical protein MARPO_0040s0129 [Marchantia polymorpha]